MVSAGEKRTDALSVNEPISQENLQNLDDGNSNINTKVQPQNNQSIRNNKSVKGKRSFKKGSRLGVDVTSSNVSQNVLPEKEEDEEEQSLHWAYSILMKEFRRRNNLREKTKVSSKKANEKLNSFLAFKKLKEEHQKKEKKKKSGDKKKLDQTDIIKPENKDTVQDSLDGKTETNTAQESKESKKVKKEPDEKERKDTKKKSIEIVNLHDQIQSKRKLVTESNEISNINQIFKSRTEKEKIKEARKTLHELNERAERKKLEEINNTGEGMETKVKRTSNRMEQVEDAEGLSNNNLILSKNNAGKGKLKDL